MASQFQYRVVGTIIVVAIGVIILPNIFDGKKEHNESQFATIPLLPEEGQPQVVIDNLPPVTEDLEQSNLVNSNNAVSTENNIESTSGIIANENSVNVATNQQANNLNEADQNIEEQTPSKAVVPQVRQNNKVNRDSTANKNLSANAAKKTTSAKREQPPIGEAYVIQLVALTNAQKVNEIVAKLLLSNYRVYTEPAIPVQGKLTRILVGPEISKEKLDAEKPKLKKLAGLTDDEYRKIIIRKYKVTE